MGTHRSLHLAFRVRRDMKILYLIDTLEIGGTPTQLKRITRGLQCRGMEQYIVCLNKAAPENLQFFRDLCIQVHVMGKLRFFTGIGLLWLFLFMRREKFDWIVTFLFVSDIIGRIFGACSGRRILSSLRSANPHEPFWTRTIQKMTVCFCDKIVANSAFAADLSVRNYRAERRKLHIIHNIITNDYSGDALPPSVRQRLDKLPKEAVLLGSIGRFAPEKGFDVLIHALSILRNPAVHLCIVGYGSLREALETQAQDYGILDRVHMVFVPAVPQEFFRRLHVYIQPSRRESMSNALMEAMGAGCAVVASDIPGNVELIEYGKYGWLFPSERPDALAATLQNVLAHPVSASKIARKAQQHIFRSYSEVSAIQEWELVLAHKY